jgi:hypothetical protein
MWKFERRLWYSKFWKENMLLSHWGVMSCHIWFGSHWGEMSCHNLLVILGSQMKAFWTRGLEWHLARKYWSVSSLFCFFGGVRETSKIHHYLLTYLSTYLSTYLFIYLFICIYIILFYFLFFILSTYLFTYLLIYLPIYLPLPWDGWKVPILKKRATKESTIPHKGGDI